MSQIQFINRISSNKLFEGLKKKQDIINSTLFESHINEKYQELVNKKHKYEKQLKNLNSNKKLYNILLERLDYEKSLSILDNSIIEKLEKCKYDFDTNLLDNIDTNFKKYENKLLIINKKLKYTCEQHLIQLRRTIKEKIDNIKKKCVEFYSHHKFDIIVPEEKHKDLKKMIDYTSKKHILTQEKKDFINETELYFINEILYICDNEIYDFILNYFII